jgi:lysophospholipid acyltransferase (LPLAT)-like uncharacterized protein
MKWLSRIAPVQIAVAWLISSYLKLCVRTIRWTIVGDEETLKFADTGQGYLLCFWHKVISLSVMSQPIIGKNKRGNAMISLSSDGALIARIVGRLGFPAVRGSRGKEGAEDKGGAGAFRQTLRLVRDGQVVAITPDGPRGPPEVMPPGPIVLARTAKVPTFMFAYACAPAVRPNTWDRMYFPLPFGRGAAVIDGPIDPPTARTDEEVAAVAAEWQQRLSAAQARAEAIVAGTAA